MTDLGKSLIQEEIEKRKAELLIKMLMQKFKKVSDEYKGKIKILPEETIELIATYIFELNSVEELENILVFLIQKFYLTMELKSWRKSRAFFVSNIV
ncbi:DUF4351 domain-containing protein [Clostridium botulinum]|nr:DUF4351 domain-containing protein [Clostridium botulinum]